MLMKACGGTANDYDCKETPIVCFLNFIRECNKSSSKIHGQGNFAYATGDVYEGEWQACKMHGRGKFIFADWEMYEGQYEEDKKHGHGKYTYPDGDVFEGQWRNDKRL